MDEIDIFILSVSGCPVPNFNAQTQVLGSNGAVLASIPTQFSVEFNVTCIPGYFFASQEFGTCGMEDIFVLDFYVQLFFTDWCIIVYYFMSFASLFSCTYRNFRKCGDVC